MGSGPGLRNSASLSSWRQEEGATANRSVPAWPVSRTQFWPRASPSPKNSAASQPATSRAVAATREEELDNVRAGAGNDRKPLRATAVTLDEGTTDPYAPPVASEPHAAGTGNENRCH